VLHPKGERLLRELEEIAIFDCIIGNTDRHPRNWRFRKDPSIGQRSIVTIDHTLAFPISGNHDEGNYMLIKSYLDTDAQGRISEVNLRKLDMLVSKRDSVDQIMRLNLEESAIQLMWMRVNWMRSEKRVFIP
jgi:hypothetical protein